MKNIKFLWQCFCSFFFFLVIFSIHCVFSYDEWDYVGCEENHQPKNCNFSKLVPITVDDFDRCGPSNMSLIARNFFLGASGRRQTYKENKLAFRRINILPEVFKDISKSHTKTTVLGLDVDFPIGISPVGVLKLAYSEGELGVVEGLSNMKTIMILSSYATTSIEDIAKRAKGTLLHLWMQTYIFKNRSLTIDIVQKAERNGFKGIVVTADTNIDGTLTCDAREELDYIKNVRLSNVGDVLNHIISPAASFRDIGWLKRITSLPIIVKGILRGEDARKAIRAGASAIMVSNHGGRQLDGAPATIDALPGVVDAVNRLRPRREVYMDSGVRSGTDVYKALARGARMVFVGRPTVWGLALLGPQGVTQMMTILKEEFNETMLLSGNTSPREIKRSFLLPGTTS